MKGRRPFQVRRPLPGGCVMLDAPLRVEYNG